MTIYLMVKTHQKTGLKYLCKTSRDPFTYRGSGIDWVLHLQQHGTDHTTEIIMECADQRELYYWGKYYSILWNVVNGQDDFGNKIWANRIPETGGGGSYGNINPMRDKKVKEKISGENHYTKQEGYVEKRGGPDHHMKQECYKKYGDLNPMKNPLVKEHHAVQNKKAQNRPEVRVKKSASALARWADPKFKNATSLKISEGNTPEVRLNKSIALTGKKQKVITCPHCGKIGGNNLKRFHFDNCKFST